jgi:hypothetical protein
VRVLFKRNVSITACFDFRRNKAISKDNRPRLSAVASPPPRQRLCCAKIIVTAAINGQDKLQLFSCLSKRQERERLFHGCNMFVTARCTCWT